MNRYICVCIQKGGGFRSRDLLGAPYTRFPVEDLGLLGPSPWEFLAQTVYVRVSGQPNPWSKSYAGDCCDGNWVYLGAPSLFIWGFGCGLTNRNFRKPLNFKRKLGFHPSGKVFVKRNRVFCLKL